MPSFAQVGRFAAGCSSGSLWFAVGMPMPVARGALAPPVLAAADARHRYRGATHTINKVINMGHIQAVS
jgi:hypothetical protein